MNHHLTSSLLSLLTYVLISSTVSISRTLKARIWSPLWKRHESWIFRQSETLERMNAQQWETQCKLFICTHVDVFSIRIRYILNCSNAGYWSNRGSMNGGRPPETVNTWWKESRLAHHIENLVLIQSHVTLTDDLSEAISAPDYVMVVLIVILNPSDQRL